MDLSVCYGPLVAISRKNVIGQIPVIMSTNKHKTLKKF